MNNLWKKHLKPDDGAERAEEAETEPVEERANAAEEAPEPQAEDTDAALKEAQAKAEEYLDMAQRVQADFDNFRRRNAQARSESYEEGARDMIKLLLPVLDNLERALSATGEEAKLHEGVELICRQMLEILEKRGVSVIDRKGEMFDPRLENAVMRAESDAGEPGTVTEVFQKGYRMGDTVIRHAMVQVVGE